MHARRHPRAAAKVEGDGGRARDGLAYLTADRVLRVTLAGSVAALLFFSMSIAAEVFYVTDVLKAGDAAYGVLMASWTLGMVAGAVGLARRIPPAALAAGALAGVAVQGARHRRGGRLAACCWAAFAGFTLGGIAHGVKNVLLRTLIHERVPDALRGRAFAAYNAARNGAELGALGAGGVLIGAIGAQPALLLSGAIPLAIGVAALIVLASPSAGLRRTAPAYQDA